jgi:putative transposase
VSGDREDFVRRALAKEKPIAQLCREYGISRKTGHKWINRYRERGSVGLVDGRRRPRGAPLATSAEMVLEIVRLRQAHPNWGAKHLRQILIRTADDLEAVPSPATIGRILQRSGLAPGPGHHEDRDLGAAATPSPVVVREPNDLWTVSFKGWDYVGDQARSEPLLVRDAISRFVLALRLLPGRHYIHVRGVFEELFAEVGLPGAIRAHGLPFLSPASLGGLTQLSAWFTSLGIALPQVIVGSPPEDGPEGRLGVEILAAIDRTKAHSLHAQQSICDELVDAFNSAWAHPGLGLKRPAEVYRASPHKLPTRPVAASGFPDGCELRKVSDLGLFTYGGRRIYASKAMAGFHVGIQEMNGELWVWFYHLLVGKIGDRRVTAPFPTTGEYPHPKDDLTENTG